MPALTTRFAQLILRGGGVAPTNTTPPAITGTRVVGFTLTTTVGNWNGSPDTYAIQWQRDSVDIPTATNDTYILQTADVGHTVTSTVIATSAFGSSNKVSSNGLFIVAPLTTTDVIVLSGGTSGLGGTPGGQITDPRAIFDDVLRSEADAGDVEYRLVYVKNGHAVQAYANALAWISSQTTSPATDLAIGVATEAAGSNVTAIANEQTAPAGVTFAAPSTSGTGLALGTLTAGQTKGLWLRRTINPGAPAIGTDTATFNISGDPA